MTGVGKCVDDLLDLGQGVEQAWRCVLTLVAECLKHDLHGRLIFGEVDQVRDRRMIQSSDVGRDGSNGGITLGILFGDAKDFNRPLQTSMLAAQMGRVVRGR